MANLNPYPSRPSMKILYALLFLLATIKAFPGDSTVKYPELNWSVVKSSPFFSFSAEFDFKRGNTNEAKVIRSGGFSPWYSYDLYDSSNALQARGITRALSLGLFYGWGIEMDVYDGDSTIGFIEGKLFTKARAKFVFYDLNGNVTANAYLDAETANFIITSAQDETHLIANLKGKSYGDLCIWEMLFNQPSPQVDPRLLLIFSAFVADYHSEFLPRKEEVNNYFFFNNRDND
jgi:hypothetical protein